MTTFSDRLKEAMYAQNLKQIDLVHIAAENNVKLGKSHVSQYVSGKTVPRNDILHFLADTLHVDADWLLGDSQENFTARENNSVAPKAPSTTKTSGSVGTSNSSKRGTTPMKKTITDKNDNDNAGSSAMHIFKKSSKLDNVLYDVRGPVVEEAARMEERGTHVLKLNIGNPAPFGFRTPDEVIYDMSQQLSDCEGYSPSQGLFSARKAIMQYSQIKKLPNVTISDIKLGKTHFHGRILLKTCTNGSSELMTNLSSSVVNALYNMQLMKFAGEDGVAAYGTIMYVNFIFVSIFFGYAIGSAPIVSYHYGANNQDELKNLFHKSIRLIGTWAVSLFIIAQLIATPLATLFVGYDQGLFELTRSGFRLYSFTFLINGFNIYGSAFFTALNNGLLSALISFLRTLVFQMAVVLLLPLLLGINGVWCSVAIAELLTLCVTGTFIVLKRNTYHYL